MKHHDRLAAISIIEAYAPTADSTQEDIDVFYNELELAQSVLTF